MIVESYKLITPLMKQCFVCAGVGLNIAHVGFGYGISSTLVPDLRRPDSSIPIDEECGSWIASIFAIALMPGILIAQILMSRCGRKVTHITGVVMLTLSWLLIGFAVNVPMLLTARFFQGISCGVIFLLGPILVGEYTTPAFRGVFLMSLGILMSFGIFYILTVSFYIAWQTVSFISSGIGVVTLVMVIFSPESPSWLASKGRFEECRATFRWLRGDKEEEELEKMIQQQTLAIETSKEEKNQSDTLMLILKKQSAFLKNSMRKKEFYLPILIMFHVSAITVWSGINIFSSYAIDLIQLSLGNDVEVSSTVIWLNLQRLITMTIGLIIVKKVKRKTMLYLSVGLNILMMVVSGVYSLARTQKWLPFDNIYIGGFLLHIHMFSTAIGALPLGFILAGELYPLRFKALASGISASLISLLTFICLKTIPLTLNIMQLCGTLWLHAGIQIYSLLITGLFLPETKDKTLQDIEQEFRGTIKHKSKKVDERYNRKPDFC